MTVLKAVSKLKPSKKRKNDEDEDQNKAVENIDDE